MEYSQVGKGTLSPPLHPLFRELPCKAICLRQTQKAGPGRLPSPACRCTNRPFFPGYSSKRTNGLTLPEKVEKILEALIWLLETYESCAGVPHSKEVEWGLPGDAEYSESTANYALRLSYPEQGSKAEVSKSVASQHHDGHD